MAANVTLSTLSEAGITKYSRVVGSFAQKKMILAQFGQVPDDLELGWKNIVYTRSIPIALSTALTDVTSTGTYTAAKKYRIQQITVTPILYADGETFDLFDTRRMFINYISGASKEYGRWCGEQLNYELTELVSKYSYHVRADWDSAYQVIGVATSGSTTTVADTVNLTQADDYWNAGWVTMTSGLNMGLTGVVSDFANATGLLTVNKSNGAAAAFPHAVASTDTFIVTCATALTTGDTLNDTAVGKAVSVLEDNSVETFEGGMYVGYIDSKNKLDYLTDLISVIQYTEKGITKLFTNELGVWKNVRWVLAPELYRTTAAGAEDRTDGVVSQVLIFGKDAFGEIPIAAAPTKPTIITKVPGPNFVNDPAADADLQGAISVKAAHAPVMLNSLYCVSILTYPTAN